MPNFRFTRPVGALIIDSYGTSPSRFNFGYDDRWPQNKMGVLEVADAWYDPSRVRLNDAAIDALPMGTIVPPTSTNLTLEIAPNVDANQLSEAMQYSLALNSINHMFWRRNADGAFERYEHNGVVGANLMSSLFQKAWQDPTSPLQQARLGVPMTLEDVHAMFGDIPDPEGRRQILNEVLSSSLLPQLGQSLAERALSPNATFDTTDAAMLASAFPLSYGDAVLKKSQLAISAVWRTAMDQGLPATCDLTAFADYQVPNVLRALGLLDYAPDLAAAIDGYQDIPAESPDEHALRGASILAVERLAQAQGVNVADVDYWLWSKRKEPKTPFHLTVTTAY